MKFRDSNPRVSSVKLPACAAVSTLARALDKGDAKSALAVLKGQGLLTPPTPGPTDPDLVARRARHEQGRAQLAMAHAELDDVTDGIPLDLDLVPPPDPAIDRLPPPCDDLPTYDRPPRRLPGPPD